MAFSLLVYLVFVSLDVPGAFRDSSVPPSHTAAGELGFHTLVTESGFTWVLGNLNAGPQACTLFPVSHLPSPNGGQGRGYCLPVTHSP